MTSFGRASRLILFTLLLSGCAQDGSSENQSEKTVPVPSHAWEISLPLPPAIVVVQANGAEKRPSSHSAFVVPPASSLQQLLSFL